jgi:hypothetical protein
MKWFVHFVRIQTNQIHVALCLYIVSHTESELEENQEKRKYNGIALVCSINHITISQTIIHALLCTSLSRRFTAQV